ncbi:MAG: VanZ family protein, partial [Proteobacteria bacterium]|nr:VanZ family protein [Pseudomonadota bacterium]
MARSVEPPASRPAGFDLGRLPPIRPALLVAAIVALALLVVFAELPGRPLILHVLQKLGHPAVFGIIAVGVLVLQLQRPGAAARAAWLQYLIAFAVAVGIGALTEAGQLFTHRDPSLRDVGLDARGIACALALAAVWDARCRPTAAAARLRLLYAAAAAALAVLILTPLAWTIAGYALRAQRFPVLFVPAARLDLLFVTGTGGRVERFALPPAMAHAPGEMALRVPLTTRPYAGVLLDEPAPDWRGYRTLVVEVTNPGRSELAFNVRVHDRSHNWTYEDRFNAAVAVAPGRRVVLEFPLEAVRSAPRGRELDLAHVAGVALFLGVSWLRVMDLLGHAILAAQAR